MSVFETTIMTPYVASVVLYRQDFDVRTIYICMCSEHAICLGDFIAIARPPNCRQPSDAHCSQMVSVTWLGSRLHRQEYHTAQTNEGKLSVVVRPHLLIRSPSYSCDPV